MDHERRALGATGLLGLRHLALKVTAMAPMRAFYEDVLGMRAVWEPDADNLYLSSGLDNLALHVMSAEERAGGRDTRLDHFGFIAPDQKTVETLHERLARAGVPIKTPLRRHRDGSVSFYLSDPDGNTVQILYEPHVSRLRLR